MATIDNKQIIDDLIKNNGQYEDDPQVYMIVEYVNAYGNVTWGVTWRREGDARFRYLLPNPPYVNEPKILWCADPWKEFEVKHE